MFPFWDTCHVVRIHKVCSLDLYAKYFYRFCYCAKLFGHQCVNLKSTHQFDELSWNAPSIWMVVLIICKNCFLFLNY
jgi:hypothetical protein